MHKRITAAVCAFVILFVGVCGRVAYITLGDSYTVSDSYNSKTYRISALYNNIYARSGELLNNNSRSVVAVIKPSEKSLAELSLLFEPETEKEIAAELSSGEAVIRSIDNYAETSYIKTVEIIEENDADMMCRHLIDKACGGLETVTDKEIGTLSVNYAVDAVGRILSGDDGKIINNNYNSADGVVISIDSTLQSIAENAAQSIEKGSVVIADASTSQILASVSRGDDYLNRAACAYTPGSVFKLVVAAAACENGVDLAYDCTGEITVGDTSFHCQKNHRHGCQTLKDALANSCNCYFVNLALELGADKICDVASRLGYCKDDILYTYDGKDFAVKAGAFPLKSDLSSQGQLALLGFGQGAITDTPLHFAAVVSCIANGGIYYSPTLSLQKQSGVRAISGETAQKLCAYMKNVVDSGTGSKADYNGKTAGKTATAQSGIYENGSEILNTWFAGFYPYSNPRYAVVVMCEGGSSGSEDCCPVFRTVVENIDKMMYNN